MTCSIGSFLSSSRMLCYWVCPFVCKITLIISLLHERYRNLSVSLSHSCFLLKQFDGCRYHLADTLAGSIDTLCHMRSMNPRKGKFWSNFFGHILQLPACDLPSGSTNQ